ncbi:glycosyltransferase [Desulfosporosinus lacus]|uniref:Tetratricopeptide repeat-containing protein n=1 Tax=Desulfosporosinus lacus DSM 15449 TaxID=1121420 RepID=A0A1M6DZI9_9FIRM|nr:glycosyltransferase family 2 protein [Desulfosporosinus lacus]SHI78611.1 Tetratricopeptide repeat-containing protein [Desulfosporosinus lacus DSM 15449]
MKTKETVSLCMIVKDEEDCILTAIQSVQYLTDELIVIDTGSIDSTPQLALSAGAKLFHFDWTKNFSMARNFALKQASTDWIIVLDADEVLETINPETFYVLLSDSQVEGYYLRIRNILDSSMSESSDQVVRLFRNRPDYRFEGAIHEQVAPSILRANNGCGLASVPLTVHHYGYLKDRLDYKHKFSRNSQIITQELKQNPENPFLLYCLGLEYYQQDSILEGLKHLTKSLTLLSGNEGYFEDVLLNIALGYLRLEEAPKLIDFLSKALSMYPDQADFLYLRGLAYLQETSYFQAAEDFQLSLHIGTMTLATFDQVCCLLGDVYQSSGDFPQAHDAYTRALKFAPASPYPLQQFISLIRKGYSIDCLLQGSLQVENWPKTESWSELLANVTSESFKLYLVMLLLTLYRTLNTKPFSHQELLALLSHFPKVSELRITESDPDMTQNVTREYLTLALKEILLCSMAMIKDMEATNSNAKNRVNNLLKKALYILCHVIESRENRWCRLIFRKGHK